MASVLPPCAGEMETGCTLAKCTSLSIHISKLYLIRFIMKWLPDTRCLVIVNVKKNGRKVRWFGELSISPTAHFYPLLHPPLPRPCATISPVTLLYTYSYSSHMTCGRRLIHRHLPQSFQKRVMRNPRVDVGNTFFFLFRLFSSSFAISDMPSACSGFSNQS